MDHSPFGTTTLEQVPHELGGAKTEPHRPWALGIIIVVALLFGAFWMYERYTDNTEKTPTVIPMPEVSTTTPTSSEPVLESSVVDLQAAAVNIAIPDFSDQF